MKKKTVRWKPKRVLRLPDLDHAKTAVLSTLGSPDSERSYRFAIDDFIAWYCSEPRLAFNKTVVLRYRLQLEARQLSASTINVRLAAVRSALSWLPAFAELGAQKNWESGSETGSLQRKEKRSSIFQRPARSGANGILRCWRCCSVAV
jgi:hypothetical protein